MPSIMSPTFTLLDLYASIQVKVDSSLDQGFAANADTSEQDKTTKLRTRYAPDTPETTTGMGIAAGMGHNYQLEFRCIACAQGRLMCVLALHLRRQDVSGSAGNLT
jgi:hypothetical protein